MKARKVGLLFLILCFGAVVETVWSLRTHGGLGPMGCRIIGGRFYGPSFAFESESRQEVPRGTAIEVENSFGAVKVSAGEPGEVRIGLRKVVYLPTEEEARSFASRIHLQAELVGPTLRVTTNRQALELSRESGDVGFETHLEIRIPPATPVKVQNEHGPVAVADAARAQVWNSHGAVRMERVAGEAEINSRHGDVWVSEVGGALSLAARHGRVEVEHASGPATLAVEHGPVSVAGAGALELVLRHGDLRASAVRRDLEFRGQHAGVEADDVGGRAQVETSFQEVRLTRVGGEVRVKVEHGGVEAADVGGAVTAEVSHNDVVLARIAGPVDVKVSHGGLRAEDLEKGARVNASGDDVVLERFRGGVEIDARRGGVRLVPAGPLTEAVFATAQFGGIRLEVPPESRFDLTAAARRGEVQVTVPGLVIVESGPSRVRGRVGGGGAAVTLRAEHGDVTVEGRPAVASRNP